MKLLPYERQFKALFKFCINYANELICILINMQKYANFKQKKWILLAVKFNLDHSNKHNPVFLSQTDRKSPGKNFDIQHDWLAALRQKSRDFKAIEHNI